MSSLNLSSLLNYSLQSVDESHYESLTRFVDNADRLSTDKNFKFASDTEALQFLDFSKQLQPMLQFNRSERKLISHSETRAALTVASVVKKSLPELAIRYWTLPQEPIKKSADQKPLVKNLKNERETWFNKKAVRLTKDSLGQNQSLWQAIKSFFGFGKTQDPLVLSDTESDTGSADSISSEETASTASVGSDDPWDYRFAFTDRSPQETN